MTQHKRHSILMTLNVTYVIVKIMQSVTIYLFYAECHYTECHYAECLC
jgi:hypothetical protein